MRTVTYDKIFRQKRKMEKGKESVEKLPDGKEKKQAKKYRG